MVPALWLPGQQPLGSHCCRPGARRLAGGGLGGPAPRRLTLRRSRTHTGRELNVSRSVSLHLHPRTPVPCWPGSVPASMTFWGVGGGGGRCLEVGAWGLSGSEPAPTRSYLVMPFMGTDLGKLMKHETLSEDRIQFLVYQMLKGLKVRPAGPGGQSPGSPGAVRAREPTRPTLTLSLSPQYIHAAGIIHRVSPGGGGSFPAVGARWGPEGVTESAHSPGPGQLRPPQCVCAQAPPLARLLPWHLPRHLPLPRHWWATASFPPPPGPEARQPGRERGL